MKLLLDEHYATAIATELRAGGHDALTVAERGVTGIDDEPLLTLADAEDRALLTNNVRDFAPMVGHWASAGKAHCGLVFTSDMGMPRDKRTIGRYVKALRALMDANPGARALTNQVRWLS